MKKILLILAALVATQFVQAQKTVLQGTLTGCPDGTRIVVNVTDGNRLVPADTLTLDGNGKYKTSFDISKATFYVLTLTVERSPMIHLFLQPKEKVTMDLQYMPAIQHIQVTGTKGSDNAEVYRTFNNLISEATIVPELKPELPGKIEELLFRNRNCLMSAFLVTIFDQNFDSFAPLYKQIHDSLAPRYPGNEFVDHLADKLRGQIVQGMEAPDIELPDSAGVMHRLSDLRGHVVLLDFWASWCRPCRAENPNVVRLYNEYHKYGFEIFSVSLDNNRASWVKAIKDDHLDWPYHGSDLKYWNSAAARTYGVNAIPATFLIGPDGTVAARNLRGQDLEDALRDIFKTTNDEKE